MARHDMRVDLGFFSHLKCKRLVARLGMAGPAHLFALWMYAGRNRQDGRLVGMDDIDVALAAEWQGDPAALIDVLLACRLLDRDAGGTLILHDWADHQPWIAGAEDRAERARANGKHGGRPPAERTQTEPRRNPEQTDSEPRRNPDGTQVATDHNPDESSISVSISISDTVSIDPPKEDLVPPAPPSPPDPMLEAILVFPVKGKPGTWALTEGKRREYVATFGADLGGEQAVHAELRRARQWCADQPLTSRKTARGMPAFLSRWLTRALERSPPRTVARALTPERAAQLAWDAEDRERPAQPTLLALDGGHR